MAKTAASRPIAREYRDIIADNRRWERFVARPGDVFVCTPAKCGTTWMQAIVATLIFDGPAPGRVLEVAPWIEGRYEPVDEMIDRLDAQTHRRSIKSHTKADGIPWYPTASYIVVGRDGRDVFMSFHNHMRNMRPEFMMELAVTAADDGIELDDALPPVDDIHEFFAWWLANPIWFEHLASFWPHLGEPNVRFVHYNDLLANLDAQMRGIAEFLAIDVDERRWPDLVERCTFAAMKNRADELADFSTSFVGGADTFLYRGSNARWRDVLTPAEL